MNQEFLARYANVLLTSVGLQEGQSLLVRSEPVHLGFAAIIAAEAYKRGARYVHFGQNELENPHLYKARIDNSRAEHLDYVSPIQVATLETILSEKWALIAVKGPEDPEFLESVDAERNARAVKKQVAALKSYSERIGNNEIAWLVAFMPTEKMAGKIMDMEPGAEALDALWRVLIPILHLDQDDPAAVWKQKGQILKQRARTLNELKLKTVFFKGPGTDLAVGVNPTSLWLGGPGVTQDGVEFSPNIPTEEVFTAPDFRRVDGRVAFTRPVLIPAIGKIVRGGWLRFEDGVAVEFGAESGAEALEKYLELDEGARALGELALVDSSSPIFQADRIFYNILFDENASCHVALGRAYSVCVEGGEEMSEDELRGAGANISNVHTDFMIGGPEVQVTGETWDGRTVELIRDGLFVI